MLVYTCRKKSQACSSSLIGVCYTLASFGWCPTREANVGQICRGFVIRFGLHTYLDFNIELLKVTHRTMVVEYQVQFEELSNMAKGWPSEALIGAFIGGLRDDPRIEVQTLRPQSLPESFEMTQVAEEKALRLRIRIEMLRPNHHAAGKPMTGTREKGEAAIVQKEE